MILTINTPHYHCGACGKGVALADYDEDTLLKMKGLCKVCYNEKR